MTTNQMVASSLNGFTRMVGSLWQVILDSTSRSPDVRIWQRMNRSGGVDWHGYDPISGDYVCFGTEDDIRSWLEARYYARDRN